MTYNQCGKLIGFEKVINLRELSVFHPTFNLNQMSWWTFFVDFTLNSLSLTIQPKVNHKLT